MTIKPAKKQERDQAWKWYRSLSINEMRAFEKKHWPYLSIDMFHYKSSFVIDMYRKENV